MGTLGVFKTILLYCVMSCMVCDEAFVGRAPQSIPCLVCAGLVCRICYNRRTGCSFHFSQAVFRQIQKCGLANLYRRNERIRRICRKLMALNLLPHRFIPRLFRDLKTQVREALTRSPLYGKDMAKQHCVATEVMVSIHAANSN